MVTSGRGTKVSVCGFGRGVVRRERSGILGINVANPISTIAHGELFGTRGTNPVHLRLIIRYADPINTGTLITNAVLENTSIARLVIDGMLFFKGVREMNPLSRSAHGDLIGHAITINACRICSLRQGRFLLLR